MTDIATLTALRIKGFAKTQAIAEATGLGLAGTQAAVAALVAEGHAEENRLGFRLTAAGRERSDAATAAERGGLDAVALEALYQRFEALNDGFKALVARWQIRPSPEGDVLNDHQDAAYDGAILETLAAVDAAMRTLVQNLAALAPRLATYGDRFAHALAQLRAGDLRFMAAPVIDSYHTVWFELHEDLIRLSGRTRAAEAAKGAAS